jgi:EAL domain-containing protein (putative c-di-GMP-specific phosphodiesterase class I)
MGQTTMTLTADTDGDDLVQSALRLLRAHLGLDVAFVSQLTAGQRVLRYVDSGLDVCPLEVGDVDPAEESFCHYVVHGQLPRFLADPARHPLAAGIAATHRVPVGTHLSVPIVFSDGTVYGTFCCFGLQVAPFLSRSDVTTLEVVAAMIAGHVEDAEARRRQHEQRRTRLRTLTVGRDLVLELVFQPIVGLKTGNVVGVEALSRFPELGDGVAQVFEDAWQLGVGVDLEVRAVAAALAELEHLPTSAYLSVNVAPATLMAEAFGALVRASDPERVVIEITEHDAVGDYEQLSEITRELCARGVRLAIDDVGTGFSGLDHILRLDPHILKIDGALIRDIDTSPAKQAMVNALMTFAVRVGTEVVAERVETAGELAALRDLGVDYGQGYHFGRPGTMPTNLPERVLTTSPTPSTGGSARLP